MTFSAEESNSFKKKKQLDPLTPMVASFLACTLLHREASYKNTKETKSYRFLAKLRHPRLVVSNYATFVKQFSLSDHGANEVRVLILR